MVTRVGFIGVGAMGSAIAGRLIDHYDVCVYDRNEAAATDLVARGARFTTPEDIADWCEVLFLCLPGPKNVEDLMLGGGGLAHGLSAGAIVVDITTSTPKVDEAISHALAERGAHFVDSPIGGGVRRAAEGTSTLMVGAEPATFEQVREVLETITPTVIHVGPVGAGHAMKLVNNLLNSIHRFAALECVRLGQACGMTQDTVVKVLNESTGRNYATEYSFVQLGAGNVWKPQGFTLELMLKDVHLANELAESLDHATPIGHMVEEFTATAIDRFGAQADQSQLMAEWYGWRP